MEKKTVAIIGGGIYHAQSEALRQIRKSNPPVIIAEPYDLEVNGVKYALRPDKPGDSRMSDLAAILIATGTIFGAGHNMRDKTPEVDIVEEFKLIQAKKSNLSRSERDAVVRKFHQIFREVK